MSDAARLAGVILSGKPAGTSYSDFPPTLASAASVEAVRNTAILDSAYAAVISYAEAINGLPRGSVSWSIVRLYYSCFYTIRSLLLLGSVVPFNSNGEYLLDLHGLRFLKGGNSSHHWNWTSINKAIQLKGNWFISQDSEDAYAKLRKHRENVNYTHHFTDPDLHLCLLSGDKDLPRRFRTYRDDTDFTYTYLEDHLALAYPTKLLFQLDAELANQQLSFSLERKAHIQRNWQIKDRCPTL